MKRVTIFSGHYGSGKTNIAVNYAFWLKNKGQSVSIADIDIVNPYFRTRDSAKELEKAGIELVSLPFANSNVDLPSLPSEVYGLVQRRDKSVVIDLGGDERGALALGRFTPYIREENCYDMFFVVNFFRPLTTTVDEAIEALNEIENAAGLKFTGIVNNSNIGSETTKEDIEKTLERAEELSKKTSLPLVMTTVNEALFNEVSAPNKFSLKLQEKLF
ncbi:MAG: P-loop NTPase [Oscillospiraceae bacterium]|nr:P-loop NTPase [Oscillospiraceae bacterium]